MTITQRIQRTVIFGAVILLGAAVSGFAAQQVRIKEVASITGLEDVQLVGYGLVVGLAGTGDKSQSTFTELTIVNMLKNIGIDVPESHIRVRNVAAVMVTGTLNPFKSRGSRLDVTVSSLGDATSLEGGTLILTPLQGGSGSIFATAQGPLATGGYDIRNEGLSRIKKNHVMVGRIPDGAIVQREYEMNALKSNELSLSLSSPDFSSAVAMANAINKEFNALFGAEIAEAIDPATVRLNYEVVARDSVRNFISVMQFVSRVENINFGVENTGRIVVNERTGTIVAGGDVRISEVAVTHGGVKVEIVNTPQVIQPQPFSIGKTEVIPQPEAVVEEKDADMIVLNNTATVSDLAHALNSLGVAPRDIISIFQAIKQAGALHGQLVIM